MSTWIIAILIPIAVGTLSALFSGNMSIYQKINKPPLSPPGFLFPIVWLLLYILMGISSYLVYQSDSPYRGKALKIYALQLFLISSGALFFSGLASIWLLLYGCSS